MNLKNHLSYIHNIGVTWFKCNQQNCDIKFKTKGNLKKHLEFVHDIGRHKCNICKHNRNISIKYKDTTKKILKICKKCYKKTTGMNSRVEEQASKYLDKIKSIRPYLVGTDMSFKSMGGCQKYRPDKIYMSSDLVLHIEIDERQHKWNKETYSCEERRITECYDEFIGKKYVVIRWNPHNYKPKDNIKKKNRKERLERLKTLIEDILRDPPKEMIYIYYLFYDIDNKNIVKNIKYKIIH